MSAALERVIAEQQAEIDSLRRTIDSQYKSMEGYCDREKKLFEQIDALLDFKLAGKWKDECKDDREKYGEILHSLRITLIKNGWCTRCAMMQHECECNDDCGCD